MGFRESEGLAFLKETNNLNASPEVAVSWPIMGLVTVLTVCLTDWEIITQKTRYQSVANIKIFKYIHQDSLQIIFIFIFPVKKLLIIFLFLFIKKGL